MIRRLLRAAQLLALLLAGALCIPGFAQISNGTIRGTVTDSTGAVLPNATVNLINQGTAEQYTDQSNKEGYYTFTALSPGEYVLKASAPGFETWKGSLTLRVAQEAVIDAKLKPGAVQETITVSDVTPIVDVGDGTLSDVKDSALLETLPTQSNNFLNKLNFSPGVIANGFAGQGNPSGTPGAGAWTRVDGVVGGSMNYASDGQQINDRNTNEIQYTAQSQETIQELKVTTSNGGAEYGQPGQVELVTKGGTNVFHGEVHELYQDGGLEAKSFNTTPHHMARNDFGGQFGGPVRIPKLYNGKDKTFFFFDANKLIQHGFASDIEGVPDAAFTRPQSDGSYDFSGYKDFNGNPVKIYDPLTTALSTGDGVVCPKAYSAGSYCRKQFAGNIIPAGRVNKTAALVASYIPTPNISGANDWQGSNWENPLATGLDDILRYTGKADRVIGSGRLSGRYTYVDESTLAPYDGTLLNPNVHLFGGHNGALSYTGPIRGTMVNEARLGVQIFRAYTGPQPISPPITQTLGLPTYPNTIAWPGFYFWDINNNYAYTAIDRNNPKNAPNQNIALGDNLSWVRGRHEMKFGAAFTDLRLSTYEIGQPGGSYNFSGTFTGIQDPTTTISQQTQLFDTGAGLADMLLGYTDQVSLNTYPRFHTHQSDTDAFAQDNWKLTPRLTLNLGLRYEYWSPYTDAGGLGANLLFNNNFPGTEAAGYPAWLGQSNPIVVIPDHGSSQDPNVIKAYQNATPALQIETATAGGQPSSLWNMPRYNFVPRIGAAFRLNDKTVLRGGYGIYQWTMPLVQYQQNTRKNQPFSFAIHNNTASNENYQTEAELTYPNGPSTNGNQSSADRILGTANTTIDTTQLSPVWNSGWLDAPWQTNYKPQQVQEWNFTVERNLPAGWAFSVGYEGNHSSHLVDYDPINALVPRELVPSNATVSSRLAYPNFTASSTNDMDLLSWIGYANHNQMIGEIKHNYHNFVFQSYFTWQRTLGTAEGGVKSFGGLELQPAALTNNAPLNQRLRAIYARDGQLPEKNFVVNGHYDLPFGKGQRFLAGTTGLASAVVTGWNTSAYYAWRSGLPFSSSYYNPNPNEGASTILAPGKTGILPKNQRTKAEWFDASVWDASTGKAYTGQSFVLRQSQLDWDLLSNVPRNNLTGPGFWESDATLDKLTPIGEHMKLDLQLQVFNLFNHVSWGLPDNTSGIISSAVTNYQPRLMQFQGKIVF